MIKYLLIAFVITFVAYTPQVNAQSTAIDAILLRIDALVLEMELLKRDVTALKGSVSSPTQSVLGAQSSKILTQSIVFGETNGDIAKIQKLLSTDPLIYPYGLATGFFGPKTEGAIRNFQSRFGLDPVGVVGPATTDLLEGFLAMYPAGNYPVTIFDKKPEVRGAAVSVTPKPVVVPKTTIVQSGTNPLRSITIELDHGEAEVEVEYKDDDEEEFVIEGNSKDDVLKALAKRIKVSESYVRAVASFEDTDDKKYDDDDAEDAIEQAEDAVDDADEEIEDAEENDEDVDYALDTLERAEDALEDAENAYDDEEYTDAVEYAEEAEELAELAEDRIGKDEDDNEKGDSDDIDSIEVDVSEDESEVVVEYDNGDEYSFTVEEDKIDEIIEEIADELDMDDDDVEDLVEFDFGKVDDIEVMISGGDADVVVSYKSGVTRRFTLDEDDEDDLTQEVADEIDEDFDDIEDIIGFDYD